MNPSDVLFNNVMIHFNSSKIAGLQTKLKKFIFSSTSEVYLGSSLNNKLSYPTKENHEILLPDLKNPRTSYMMSKIFCEAFNNLSKIPFLNIRPHNIFGPRMGFSHVIPEIIIKSLKIKKGGKFYLQNPNHKRSFCYISDAVNQIIFITNSKKYLNGTFNIGSDKKEISVNNLTKKILKIIKRKNFKIIKIKKIFNSSPKRRLPDMSNIKKYFSKYDKVTLNDGIYKTHLWYKKYFVSEIKDKKWKKK